MFFFLYFTKVLPKEPNIHPEPRHRIVSSTAFYSQSASFLFFLWSCQKVLIIVQLEPFFVEADYRSSSNTGMPTPHPYTHPNLPNSDPNSNNHHPISMNPYYGVPMQPPPQQPPQPHPFVMNYPLKNIPYPHAHDVLCGRGK